jgi:hypothetical protein
MPETIVVVRTYLTAIDAELAQTVLEAEGIESMVRSDDCGGQRPHLWMHGVELLVRGEDAERAARILADAPPGDTPAPRP